MCAAHPPARPDAVPHLLARRVACARGRTAGSACRAKRFARPPHRRRRRSSPPPRRDRGRSCVCPFLLGADDDTGRGSGTPSDALRQQPRGLLARGPAHGRGRAAAWLGCRQLPPHVVSRPPRATTGPGRAQPLSRDARRARAHRAPASASRARGAPCSRGHRSWRPADARGARRLRGVSCPHGPGLGLGVAGRDRARARLRGRAAAHGPAALGATRAGGEVRGRCGRCWRSS